MKTSLALVLLALMWIVPAAAAPGPATIPSALSGDSRGSGAAWNEFFHSDAGVFLARGVYRVSFDYTVVAHSDNAEFYALFRRAGSSSGNMGWTQWQGEPGTTGHVEMTLDTRDTSDYILIIGIHNRGAITLRNLVIHVDPSHPSVAVAPAAPLRTWKSLGHSAYYVDSRAGDDAADGRSEAHAWRSLTRVNAGTFGPGDRVLLRAGSHWDGFLAPGGSGTPSRPVTLTRYGRGAKPQIDGRGLFLATLQLTNQECWDISGLDIANHGAQPQPKLTGVGVSAYDFGTARHIVLRDLDVHDVTGSNVKDEGGGAGINCACGGDKVKSRFDGLTIEGCHLTRTDRNGITMNGNWARNASWFPSLHVVIRGNHLDDIGGDGIVPIGCDGALVEHNVLHGGRMRAQDYAAGIWPWSCDNTTIQYNEVSGMKGTNDGEGYDCDYNCRNTLFQYNFSHDNDGGFMLICDDGSQHLPWNIGNIGSVIRYNISVNDGLHTFNITGPCQHTKIYNNTFYIAKGRHVDAVAAGNWGGAYAEDTHFLNNLFFADGQAKFGTDGLRDLTFEHNAFWGDIPNRPGDSHAVLTDPKLAAPGAADPRGYAPRTGSPCLGAGIPVPGNGGRDFWGRRVPAASAPSIGAAQTAA